MKRKIIIYFVMASVFLGSIAMYFISRENSNEQVVITGEYEIWETQNTTELTTESTTSIIAIIESSSEQTKVTSIVTDVIETTITESNVYLNINSAASDELQLLDGIGEVTATKIIGYRNNCGGFNNIEEIMNVSGIGEKTFLNIKEHIYVENPFYPENEIAESSFYINESSEEINLQNQTENVIIEVATETITTPPETSVETLPTDAKFNLNKVTSQQLVMIPTIDREIAEKIIAFRTSIQYFSNTYELLYVDGMTEQKLREIINYFYIEENSKD